jgi:hypothetical protein
MAKINVVIEETFKKKVDSFIKDIISDLSIPEILNRDFELDEGFYTYFEFKYDVLNFVFCYSMDFHESNLGIFWMEEDKIPPFLKLFIEIYDERYSLDEKNKQTDFIKSTFPEIEKMHISFKKTTNKIENFENLEVQDEYDSEYFREKLFGSLEDFFENKCKKK